MMADKRKTLEIYQAGFGNVFDALERVGIPQAQLEAYRDAMVECVRAAESWAFWRGMFAAYDDAYYTAQDIKQRDDHSNDEGA